MEDPEVLAADVAVDPTEDVYGIADMLLQGDDDEGGGGQVAAEDASVDAPAIVGNEGAEGWVNPLASIQAFSVEPQVLLQEMLEHDGQHLDFYVGDPNPEYYAEADDGEPDIIQIDPSTVDKNASEDQEKNQTDPKQKELVAILAQSVAPKAHEKETVSPKKANKNSHPIALQFEKTQEDIESEDDNDAVGFDNIRDVREMEEEKKEARQTAKEDTDQEEDVGEPQYNIVSLDPTAFPDAKVKKLVRPHRSSLTDIGRRSQNKRHTKPRKLSEKPEPEEPQPKRPRRNDLKVTISLKNIKTEPYATAAPKRGPGRPRTKPFREPVTKLTFKSRGTGRPRGRPKGKTSKTRPLPPVENRELQIKSEPVLEGYGDDLDTSETYCPFEGRPRRSKRKVKGLKGTHIMKFKEYRCFECNNDRVYTDKEAYLEHWRGTHFVVEESGANLYCSSCNQKFTVYLQRFHRAADVLQYLAFYFNHRLKRHGMQSPPYIEELSCPDKNCHFTAYTTYALSRHVHEGKHRMRGPKLLDTTLDCIDHIPGKGNKYALNFREFKCFVCNDDKTFDDLTPMLNHWRSNHFQFTAQEAVILCAYCDAQYKVPKVRFHRQTDTMQYIAYFFSHLVKKHNIEVPPYIEQLNCSQPGCRFVTYTKQLLQRHLQEVKHITLSRTPALDNQDSQNGVGIRSPYLSFKEYRCFLCVTEQGEHQGPFDNGAVFADHWRDVHFAVEDDRATLRCNFCVTQYQIQIGRYARNADVLAMIARYFTHLVKKHSFEPPSYIDQLQCTVAGCGYKCFTPQIMDGHRMTKRDPAHMGVMEGVPGSDQLPALSLRHLNRGQGLQNPEKVHQARTSSQSSELAVSQVSNSSPVKKDASTANTNSSWNSDIVSLSKKIADGVLKNLTTQDDVPSGPAIKDDDTVDFEAIMDNSLLNQSTGSLEESIDTSEMKAKSLLCYLEIRCFECNDGKVYASHGALVNHWRNKHFHIGTYEVYIQCIECDMRIGLNKPLWHRDHDIGRCVASYLTHSMKKHSTPCPKFIKELECPEPGCEYRTLTVKHMQFHVRHTKHHKLEKAKRAAAGLDPSINTQDYARRSLTFRINDNGLTFKEYQCYLCADGVFYKNCIDYENHWRQVHVTIQDDKDCLRCHVCSATFISHLYPSIAFLFCHLVKKHEFPVPWYIEEYTCEEEHCNYITYTKALLAKHKMGQRHSSGSGIFQYYLNFREYRCFLCPAPNQVFPSKKVYENHLMSNHVEKCGDGGDYLRCPECNHHFTLHHCKKPEINYDKPDPSRTLCVLFNHVIVKHKWEIPNYLVSFECPHEECSFTTVRKYTLDRHVASHTADQQCYQCGMFFSKTRIDKHFKKCLSGETAEAGAQGSRSYPCPDCGVSINQKKTLRRHMQEVHGKTITDLPETKYKKPKASETGIAYKCDDCGKILLERKSMKRHLQSIHMKIVEGKNLHAIQYQANRGEDGPKHYECMLCGVQMNLMKSVKRHMMKQHGIKVGGARDLESCYVRVDPQVPGKPYDEEEVIVRKDRPHKKLVEYQMPSQHLSTIDDSEISDFAVVSQQRPYTAVSPEPNRVPSEQALIEMTSVQHYHRPEMVDTLRAPPQQSIFPTAKPIVSTSISPSTSQALDFRMRLGDLEAGEIPNTSALLTHQRLINTGPVSTMSQPQQTISGADLQHNPSSILSIAARHIHNGHPPQMTLPTSSSSQAHRIEMLTQRFISPQAPSMGIMPGTVDPRDINVHIPMEYPPGTLFGQRLSQWNLPNQS